MTTQRRFSLGGGMRLSRWYNRPSKFIHIIAIKENASYKLACLIYLSEIQLYLDTEGEKTTGV